MYEKTWCFLHGSYAKLIVPRAQFRTLHVLTDFGGTHMVFPTFSDMPTNTVYPFIPQKKVSPFRKDIIVFSHLRWEFVIQRPQHIINRLARHNTVLFVEEPIPFNEENRGTVRIIKPSEKLTVLQPRIGWEQFTKELKPIVKSYAYNLGIRNPVLWFYSPSFVDMAAYINHSLIVYDVMDELTAFLGAPKELIEQGKELLSLADVVFTGGKSLYESKKRFHDNVYCFPSSVDKKHFDKVFDEKTIVPRDLKKLKKPIVGFYGVIDERIDLKFLGKIADASPHASFVMIGPVVKINEQDLPRRANIHYLGGKAYKDLPRYLKGIDIAMMPFALNKATKFISPTKTLEFMAAHKPIISTPVYDVVRDYQKEVSIVKNSREFTNALKRYLSESEEEKNARIALQDAVIAKTSWKNTVEKMKQHMAEALSKTTILTPKERQQEMVTPLSLKLAYE